MTTGFFSSGVSGLNAAKLGLLTTEHNIANVNTPGYNRQRTIQAANPAALTGAGYIGQGVSVSTVERIYSGFLSAQVNQTQTTVSELDAYAAQIKQIDDMLADPSAGLTPALQDFFKGVQDAAANPSQLPARQSMISAAQTLASRYQTMAARLNEINEGVSGEITGAVASINGYAEQIAGLNQMIASSASSSNAPNDLLDQRDQLIAELNKLIKVSTTTDDNGSLNVFVGTGQQLVIRGEASRMAVVQSSADPSKIEVGVVTSGSTQEISESLIVGGSLGGLLKFRNESLDKTTNELGRNAASLALTFNAQHALGQDLLGQSAATVGGTFQASFFSVPQPSVTESATNPPGGPTVTASFNTPTLNGNFYTDLTGSDYELKAGAGSATLTRLSDNKQWTGADVAAINAALAAEPQGFTLATTGALSAGSGYLIKPTRDAASNISVNTAIAADARLVAAAAPIRTQAGSGNTGTSTISAGSVAPGYPSAVSAAPLTLNYDSTTVPPSLNFTPVALPAVLPAVSVTVPGTPPVTTNYASGAPIPYTSGATIAFLGSGPSGGFSFQIAGTPNNGDKFTVSKNAAGVSDGRNALALGQLQTQNTMSGKTASFQGTYAQLVNDTGNKTREAQIKGAAQQALLAQSQASRDSLSGVNLDEEAANLIRYQQAYQAAAKVIEVTSKLFDTLTSLG
ncbi:MAG: flagellar hook-associated protein FlgK [Betaproteobacteria bacterium]|nr:flagellar hook-associated protein FlgK [Betaproteobacteria bacterium]